MIEKLVTSLEVSRKLKALGIIQESCFYWVGLRDEEDGLCLNEYYSLVQKEGIFKKQTSLLNSGITDTRLILDSVSAFTVTELGAMLSRDIHHTVPDDSAGLLLRLLLRLIDGIKKDHQLNDCDFKEVVEGWNENLKKWRDK